MNEENLKAMHDIISVMIEKLKSIREEVPGLINDCDHLRHGLITAQEEETVRTVDPLQAPEIEGADKDGDGGFARRIGQAPRE